MPDPDDRYVLVAATRAGANVIITFNLSNFPADVLKIYRIEAQYPGELVVHLGDLAPKAVALAARICALAIEKPTQNLVLISVDIVDAKTAEDSLVFAAYEVPDLVAACGR